jgi:hypothetical protein
VTVSPRRRRRGRAKGRVAWALALLIVFLVGIAFGQALEDHPRPASTITRQQTLTVLPESATVTVTAP